MKKSLSVRGFIQIPAALLLVVGAIAGAFGLTKLPEYIDRVQQDQIRRELSQSVLPAGTASSEEILVGFKSGVVPNAKDFVHARARAALEKRIEQINTDVVRIPADKTVQEVIDEYKARPEVEYAEPNFLAAALLTPNDPLYGNQWNLKKVLAEEAYDVSKGGFGPIAVIDTGVDRSHPDLSGLVLEGYNTIDDSTNAHDDHGHGTHVAGIASAQTDNGNGVASISYRSSILPVKVLNKEGWGTYDDVSEGIIYSADNGARIMNLSLGGSSDSTTLKRAVNYALNRGSMIVAAAGNNGNDAPVYPAAYQGVLAISASDKNDNLASFSSYGGNIFVASPGVSITSTVPGGNYNAASGTSMAAPHLAGLIAMVLSHDSSLSGSEVLDQIKNNAEKVGPYAYDEDGWNPYFGYGRISSGKTLTSVSSEEETVSVAETTTQEESDSSSRLPAQARVPAEYRFSFELQGSVEGLDLTSNKFTARVIGGTPDVMKTISDNLVDIYTDNQTRILYQGRRVSLSQISAGTRVNVKGSVIQNKLVALEILVQSRPESIPTYPVENLPNQGGSQNIPQSQQPVQGQPEQSSQTESGGQGAGSGTSPVQAELQDQAKGKGVRGVSTGSILEEIINNIFGLFR